MPLRMRKSALDIDAKHLRVGTTVQLYVPPMFVEGWWEGRLEAFTVVRVSTVHVWLRPVGERYEVQDVRTAVVRRRAGKRAPARRVRHVLGRRHETVRRSFK